MPTRLPSRRAAEPSSPLASASSHGRAAGLLSLAGAAWLAACSAIVDTSADQCSTNADCTAKGTSFAGMICSAQKVCVKGAAGAAGAGAGGASGDAGSGGASGAGAEAGSGGAGGEAGGMGGGAGAGGGMGCKTTMGCVAAMGDNHICRKSDGACVSLLSQDCARVFGNYKDDNAFIIGSVAPTLGSDQKTGLALQNSVELAIKDFQVNAGGLPPAKPGGATRPIVMVGCNDNSDGEAAVRAAQHLTSNLNVPAIIGAAFSGITIKMATSVTIPAGTLVISPSATSTAITDLDDSNLVWRTSPSDVIQSDALVKFMPQIEVEVRERNKIAAGAPIKVAILNKGDSYGKGLATALLTTLVFNGKSALANGENFLSFDYGNSDDPQTSPTKYPEALLKTFNFKPDIIMAFGTNETVTEIFQKVEEGWGAQTMGSPPRPFYVFADGSEVVDLWTYLQAKDTDGSMRKRIIGTVPGTNSDNYKIFRSNYISNYNDGTSPDVFGTAGGYDALYLLAFAASVAGENPTGAKLAQGLARLVPPGTIVKAGGQIGQAFTALSSGQNIDFDGASGPLNFDVKTGDAPSDIQFWCMPPGGDGKALPGANSGALYDAALQTVPESAMATLEAFCKF